MKNNNEVYRIIDANLNRSREGIRVIEDFVRFVMNDADVAVKIKNLRHGLDIISRKAYPKIIMNRNSHNDVFRDSKESCRKTALSVFLSNVKRVEESLRTLEEFSKVFSDTAGYRFKKIRFKIYDIEKEVISNYASNRKRCKKTADKRDERGS
ncbi:MAG: thiamine-phosphate pyrophosphorylase [Elusimicrobia bacterium ADurb.Bin231]|nr:MAG: thiamine-phosphate pyrophosphorylase [Elusimicrobia bacterium ADurb.Bin231]